MIPDLPAPTPRFGVRSEVGRLRTVMLHRPGNELRRLTPRNNDALLFDGLPWVDRAQDEHDAFADALRAREVEVLYLSRLLAEAMADPDARARAIELTLTDIRLGDTLRDFLHAFLTDLAPEDLENIPGIGSKTVEKIKDVLSEYYAQLPSYQDDLVRAAAEHMFSKSVDEPEEDTENKEKSESQEG